MLSSASSNGRLQVVAQPEVHGDLAVHPPLVLDEEAVVVGGAVDVGAGLRSGRRRRGCRAGSRPGRCPCRRSRPARKRNTPKSSAPVKTEGLVQLIVPDVRAGLEGVAARDPGDVVAELDHSLGERLLPVLPEARVARDVDAGRAGALGQVLGDEARPVSATKSGRSGRSPMLMSEVVKPNRSSLQHGRRHRPVVREHEVARRVLVVARARGLVGWSGSRVSCSFHAEAHERACGSALKLWSSAEVELVAGVGGGDAVAGDGQPLVGGRDVARRGACGSPG